MSQIWYQAWVFIIRMRRTGIIPVVLQQEKLPVKDGPILIRQKLMRILQRHSGHWDPAQTTKTMAQYIDDVAVPQVKELLTNYGDVAVLWWDTPTGMTDEFAEKLNALLKLQPNIITNDRLKRPNFPGDYKTPEQRIPNLSELDGKDWETCMTMNETWGYKSWANNWKSLKTIIQNTVDIASKGGNYLLNVGPKADGTFPQESIDLLKGMGEWMKVNGESIYGTKASPFGLFPWGRCTKKENGKNTTLYFSYLIGQKMASCPFQD